MAATSKKGLTTKQAIEQAMTGARKPMTVAQIADKAIPLSSLGGKTPKQVIYSVLYSEKGKADGLVVQTGKGEFKLNPKRAKAVKAAPASAKVEEAPAAA